MSLFSLFCLFSVLGALSVEASFPFRFKALDQIKTAEDWGCCRTCQDDFLPEVDEMRPFQKTPEEAASTGSAFQPFQISVTGSAQNPDYVVATMAPSPAPLPPAATGGHTGSSSSTGQPEPLNGQLTDDKLKKMEDEPIPLPAPPLEAAPSNAERVKFPYYHLPTDPNPIPASELAVSSSSSSSTGSVATSSASARASTAPAHPAPAPAPHPPTPTPAPAHPTSTAAAASTSSGRAQPQPQPQPPRPQPAPSTASGSAAPPRPATTSGTARSSSTGGQSHPVRLEVFASLTESGDASSSGSNPDAMDPALLAKLQQKVLNTCCYKCPDAVMTLIATASHSRRRSSSSLASSSSSGSPLQSQASSRQVHQRDKGRTARFREDPKIGPDLSVPLPPCCNFCKKRPVVADASDADKADNPDLTRPEVLFFSTTDQPCCLPCDTQPALPPLPPDPNVPTPAEIDEAKRREKLEARKFYVPPALRVPAS